MKKLKSLLKDEGGQAMVEYAILTVFLFFMYEWFMGSSFSVITSLPDEIKIFFSKISGVICLPGP